MADVRTSLVGENGIAGRKKSLLEIKKTLLGEKCIVLTMTQFIQKINKKIHPKNSPTKVSQPHRGGGLGGRDNVLTLSVLFCDGTPKCKRKLLVLKINILYFFPTRFRI